MGGAGCKRLMANYNRVGNETDEASSCPKLDMYVFCKAEQEPCICVTFRIMGQPRFELGFEPGGIFLALLN